jgi:hypothetical protein
VEKLSMGVLNKKKKSSLLKVSSRSKSKKKASKIRKAITSVANRYAPVSEVTSLFKKDSVRRRKRMNPMNARAARRAATRVKSSIKMLERLKKSLPHVTSKGKVTVRKSRR